MLNFYANEFIEIMSVIMLWADDKSLFELKDDLSEILKDVERITDDLIKINFKNSLLTANRLTWLIKNTPDKRDTIHQQLNELVNRIYDEFNIHHLLILSPTETEYYGAKESLFGEKVALKFSELTEDISEASNCYALGRYTACVFHLMRIMEKTVQYFGKKTKVVLNKPIIEENWYKITRAINDKVKSMPDKTKRQRDKKDKYGATVSHLDNIRRAWRNKTMHPKVTYTQEQAATILNAVDIFMKELVNIL